MIREIDHSDIEVAHRIVEIQRAAYAVEAELIGFHGIPQLVETADDVRRLDDLQWRGAFAADELVGVIAWRRRATETDIDRLAIDPDAARRGHGRRLVRSVPRARRTTVSTGEKNEPAVQLYLSEGFVRVGSTEIAPQVLLAEFERAGDPALDSFG